MIPVFCPQCGLGLQAPDHAVGRKAKCRRCQTVFVIDPVAIGSAPRRAAMDDALPFGAVPPPPDQGAPAPGAPPGAGGDWLTEITGSGQTPTAPASDRGDTLDDIFSGPASRPSASARRRPGSGGGSGGLVAAGLIGACAIGGAVWFLKPQRDVEASVKLVEMPPESIVEMKPYRLKMSGGTGSDTTLVLRDGPEGAVIDPVSGDLTWTPTEAQGPGTYKMSVVTQVVSTGAVTSRINLTLQVEERSDPPVFDPVDVQYASVETEMSLQLVARDTDNPPSRIIYSLKGGKTNRSPDLDPDTGRLTWTPREADAGKKVLVVVVATEEGEHPLTTEYPVHILVNSLQAPLDRISGQLREAFGTRRIEHLGEFTKFDIRGSSHILEVDGEEFYLFVHKNPAAAQEEVDALLRNRIRLTSPASKRGETARYYLAGETIVLYIGRSASLLSTFENLFGRPFATVP